MSRVLIIDDRAVDREFLRSVLEGVGHDVVEAEDGEEGLALARQVNPALILSDILLPGRDGFSLCRELQKDAALRHVPFVFVTAAYAEERYQQFARDVGAVRVLRKPFTASQLRKVVADATSDAAPQDMTQRLRRLDDSSFHERHAEAVTSKLRQKVAELEAANEQLRESEALKERSFRAMVATISKMVEYRDPYTIGHERRVGLLGAAIATELGLPPRQIEGIRVGGFLHDVGKIAVPAEMLAKPARLSTEELAIIRVHCTVGHDILSNIEFPWPVATMALQHHERMDGSGYPQGLKGTAILLESRILAVADVIEAMSSHRPYRAALGLEQALKEVADGAGTAYDADVSAACLRLFHEGLFQFEG